MRRITYERRVLLLRAAPGRNASQDETRGRARNEEPLLAQLYARSNGVKMVRELVVQGKP